MTTDVEKLEKLRADRRKRIMDDKDYASSRVSELSRYIGFGLAAFTVLIMTSDAVAAKQIYARAGSIILVCSALGCLAVAFDYLQYLVGYHSSEQALKNKAGDYVYLTTSPLYRARRWLFGLKQGAALFGSIIFAITLLSLAVSH